MANNKASNCTKLRWLLWKNMMIQKEKWWQYLIALIILFILLGVILIFRYLKRPELVDEMRYRRVSIDDLSLFNSNPHTETVMTLVYSPLNDIYEEILKTASNKLSLDLKAYANAKELEKAMVNTSYLAAVEFDDNTADIKKYPKKFTFRLRFPQTLRMDSMWSWLTGSKYYIFKSERNRDRADGGSPVGYIVEGFLPIQHAVTMAYLELASNNSQLPKVWIQRFPNPEYMEDGIAFGVNILKMLQLIIFVYVGVMIIINVATEKELQLKELMKISGVQSWLHWLAWFIVAYIIMLIFCIIFVFIYKYPFIEDAQIVMNTDWSVLLFFFAIYAAAFVWFCFLISVIFSTAMRASIAGVIFLILATSSFFIKEPLAFTTRILLCLLMNSAMDMLLDVISIYEDKNVGLVWANVATQVSHNDKIVPLYIWFMLLFDAILYMLLCLYIEQIHGGEYHIPKKWNFPCKQDFWSRLCCSQRSLDEVDHERSQSSSFTDDFEKNSSESEGESDHHNTDDESEVGIRLDNLVKKFGNHTAVNGVTLNMYVNEITVLLGHNGAGKTTTILMMIGIITPTKGTAYINGYDIRNNLTDARSSMGICPQHNVLFDNMSVKNNIKFFSALKGVKGKKNMQAEVKNYIELLGLTEKANIKAKKLSGGMKRKLCLCCAMCGSVNVVIFDEPTAGVDAASRRQVWSLLQQQKQGRTILLTTHYMDEAEVLGNRIAIMSGGKINCYGKPLKLKDTYGSGYRLICGKAEQCDTSKVTSLIRRYVPEAKPESENSMEITYRLPNKYLGVYHKIFAALENGSEKLKIASFSVNVPTIDDVFMQFGAEKGAADGSSKEQGPVNGLSRRTRNVKKNACRLCCLQWRAMFLKHWLLLRHSWLLFLFSFILPLILFIPQLISESKGTVSNAPLEISLNQYSESVAVIEKKSDSKFASEYEKFVESFGTEIKVTDPNSFEDYILQTEDRSYVNTAYLVGATFATNTLIAWLNNYPLHTAPLTLNVLHNAMARSMLGSEAEVKVWNAPLILSADNKNERQADSPLVAKDLTICLCVVPAFYVVHVVRERVTNSKLQQFLSGANVFVFWISQFLWNLLSFNLLMILFILIIVIVEVDALVTWPEILVLFWLLFKYSWAILPITYVVCFCFKTAPMAFVIVLTTNFVIWFVALILMSMYSEKKIIILLLELHPIAAIYRGLSNLENRYSIKQNCQLYLELGLEEEQVYEAYPECRDFPDILSLETPGVLTEIIILFVIGILFFIIVILIDSCVTIKSLCVKKKKNKIHDRSKGGKEKKNKERNKKKSEGEDKSKKKKKKDDEIDEDVVAEMERISNLCREDVDKYALVVDKISKNFGALKAVRNVSFCVSDGECYGLLGVNGAGKTTTFKMLVGDLSIGSGYAHMKGIDLRTEIFKARKHFGYCPQFDALFDNFTGREVFKIYGLLRGLEKDAINSLFNEFAKLMKFTQHVDKIVKNYSGGTKRKLSTAIAILGNPLIVYLDEPTAGMDPATRHQLWDIIRNIQADGKSLVLTSHNMDECEQLCTRLSIMVKGRIKCIGSIQHLRNKYSKGLIVKLKVRNTERDINTVTQFIYDQFPLVELQENYQGHLTFYVAKEDVLLSEMFELFRSNQKKLKIEFYNIGHTGLEEIFLNFAKEDN